MAKKNEIQNKTEQELTALLTEKREALRGFRFDLSGSKTRNVKQGKGFRKEIAKILTLVNSRKVLKK